MSTASQNVSLLVIDDDRVLCELLANLLQSEGFQVTVGHSASAAMQLLETHNARFDAVLTDLRMPGTSGWELAHLVRQSDPQLLLLGMSARTPSSAEIEAFDAFLQKPFSVSDFRTALASASERRAGIPRSGNTHADPQGRPVPSTLPEWGSTTIDIPATAQPGPAEAKALSPEDVLDIRIFHQLRATIGPVQLRQLYEMTADDVEARLARMKASLLAGAQDRLREEAHAIKGGCSMIGAVELSKLAAAAELGPETGSAQLEEMAEACVRLRQMVTIVPP